MTKVHQRLISILEEFLEEKSMLNRAFLASRLYVSTKTIQKGQIMIGNNSFGKYKGELQIILKEIPIDERKNIVGTIAEEELFLLDYVGAWTQFTCVE
jgi:hypothetical protein